MRPHLLRLTAFGPFADTVTVDFDALARHGLVLLHGDTGAGKTTLLDAMGYALFGRVAGIRNTAQRLGSDHASPQLRPAVELEATIGGRRVHITRQLAWERPKRRGTGTTRENAEVLVEIGPGTGTTGASTVLTRHDEAAVELGRLLGMSAEQFFQVVLLPQGEFASFLRADASQRADLLTRLFATERFGAVEDWLAHRRRETGRELATARQELDLALSAVRGALGDDLGPELAELTDPAGWARGLLDAAAEELQQRRAAVTEATAVRDAAARRQAATATLADRQRRRRESETALAALAVRAEELAELRGELTRAEAAAEVVEVVRLASTAAVVAEQAAVAVAPALAAAELPTTPEPAVGSIETRVDEQQRRLGALAELTRVEAAVRVDAAEQEAAAADAERARASLGAVDAELTGLPVRRETAVARLAAADAAANRLPAVEARTTALTGAGALAGALRDAVDAHERAERADVAAAEIERDALDTYHELRKRRLAGMAGELAADLAPGEPCPVCGAREHPAPAAASEGRAGADAEEAAAESLERARRTAGAAGTELAGVVERVRTLAERLVTATRQLGEPEEPVVGSLALATAEGSTAVGLRDPAAAGVALDGFAGRLRDRAEAVGVELSELRELAAGRAERAERLAAVAAEETRLQDLRVDHVAASATRCSAAAIGQPPVGSGWSTAWPTRPMWQRLAPLPRPGWRHCRRPSGRCGSGPAAPRPRGRQWPPRRTRRRPPVSPTRRPPRRPVANRGGGAPRPSGWPLTIVRSIATRPRWRPRSSPSNRNRRPTWRAPRQR